MTKTTALLFASLFASSIFTATACDSGEEPVAEELVAEAERPEDAPDELRKHPGERGERGHRAAFVAHKLCAEFDCSDEQVAEIEELFATHRGAGDRAARRAARARAHRTLADAFRAEDFDPAILEQVRPEHGEERQARMIELAVGLHALLSPEQRAALSEMIEQRGPMFLGRGKRGKRGHHARRGHHAKGDRLARKVDHLCRELSCSAEQRTQLQASFEGAKQAHREARETHEKPDFSRIAALFRAETLDADALATQLEAAKAEHEARRSEHGEARGALVAEVHAILTPEQRAIVAERIEAEGPRALMGGKRHRPAAPGEK